VQKNAVYNAQRLFQFAFFIDTFVFHLMFCAIIDSLCIYRLYFAKNKY